MAIVENLYTGDGVTVLYSFTFPYIDETHINVSVDTVDTTEYTLANASTVEFNVAPANGAAIRIYRVTDNEDVSAVFYPGSSVRAQDLNDNFRQTLYVSQETTERNLSSSGDYTITGNWTFTKPVTGVAPTDAAHLTTKAYVDSQTGGPLSIDGLTDVDTSTTPPSNGQVLEWDGVNWVPATQAGGATSIDDLSDVDTTTTPPSNGQFLSWDGANWVPATAGGGGGTPHVSITDYGAVGDFTSDSSPALLAAITAMNAQGGGGIFIPAGVYKVGSQVDLTALGVVSNITIYGEGPASIFKFANAYAGASDRWLYDQTNIHSSITLKSFAFDGNESNMGAGECLRDKIIKLWCNNFVMSDTHFYNEAGRGVITVCGDNILIDSNRFTYIGARTGGASYASDSSSIHPGQATFPANHVIVSNNIHVGDSKYTQGDNLQSINHSFIDAIIGQTALFTNNTSYGGNQGLLLTTRDGTTENVVISDNSFDERSRAIHVYANGVATGFIRDLLISDNTIKGATGIRINGCTDQGQASRPFERTWTFTAVGGETVLSGLDDNAVTLGYTPGREQVRINGVLKTAAQGGNPNDYTATDGTSITLTVALTASDVVSVISPEHICERIKVSGNIVRPTAAGQGGTGSALRVNHVLGLTADSNDLSGYDTNGLHATITRKASVLNNTIYENLQHGVEFEDVQDLQCVGNNIYNNSRQTDNQYSGLKISNDVVGFYLEQNRVGELDATAAVRQKYGININDSATISNGYVRGNTLYNNKTSGFFEDILNVVNLRVEGNEGYNNVAYTCPQLTGNQTNYNAGRYADVWLISSSSVVQLQGLRGGTVWDGRHIYLLNVGSNSIDLVNESGSADPEVRFALASATRRINANNGTAHIVYDGTSQRWRLLAFN